MNLFLATQRGFVLAEYDNNTWRIQHQTLLDREVTSLIARAGTIIAGTRVGIFLSNNLGQTWREASVGITIPLIRWLAYHPEISNREFAGTEPAGIFISHDGADTWAPRPNVTEMRQQYNWSLPYSPEAGCVRGFAFHGQRGYAAVEDGAVLVSQDAGESWNLAKGSRGNADHNPGENRVHSDVHSIDVHPTDPDLILAPTGGGLYRSADGGATWELLYRCYCRAAWWDPQDPAHIIFGPADGVDRGGRIEESWDGGASWQKAGQGFSGPWASTMIERFHQGEDNLFMVLSNGELYATQKTDLNWKHILPEAERVNMVATMAA